MADVEALFAKGSEAFNKKNWDYAIEIFKTITLTDPNHVKARQALRMTVIQKCQQAGFPGSLSSKMRGAAASMQISASKGEKKIAVATDYLIGDPMHVGVRVALGTALMEGNFVDGAITEFEHVLQSDAVNKHSMKALGDLHQKKGDVKKAIEYYSKVQSMDNTDREVTSKLKNLLAENTIKEGGMDKAKSFRDMVKDTEGASRAEKDKQLVKTGAEMDEEIQQLLDVVNADPTNPQQAKTLKKISEMQVRKKDYDAAIASLERAKELDRGDGTIKMKIGDIQITKLDQKVQAAKAAAGGDTTNAAFKAAYVELVKFRIEEFQRRVRDFPTDMSLHFELGKAQLVGGMVDQAIAEFQMTIKDPKRKIESMNYLGQCFHRKKIHDLAATQFLKALEAAPTQEWELQLRYNLIDCYSAMNKLNEAKDECKKIMNIDISYKDVSKRLEELNARG
ncbi:MAG: tetratricopeptide repeat protein [Candidatus Brocadiae bacterium]|nr:tetratricopeptide repeat protein [Candidatus Brocadiia bacterium]